MSNTAYRKWSWEQIAAGTGVVVVGLSLVPLGWDIFGGLLVAVGGFIVLKANRHIPAVEAEAAWKKELWEFRHNLQLFCEIMQWAYEKYRDDPHEDPSASTWEKATRAASWPCKNTLEQTKKPLHLWRLEELAAENQQLMRFTETIYRGQDRYAGSVLTPEDFGVLHRLRRDFVNLFSDWGDRLNQNVPGFAEFVERHQLQKEYRHIVLLVAYVQIALARRDRTALPAGPETGFWILGDMWTRADT